MTVFFNFEPLLAAYERAEPYKVIIPGNRKEYGANGKLIEYPESTVNVNGALVPMSANQIRKYENGMYTAKDRMFYCRQDLPDGSKIDDGTSVYRITQDQDYREWTNVRIYTCSALERGYK